MTLSRRYLEEGQMRTLYLAAVADGRALNDDVSDIFLGILTNGKVTGDKVGPHNDLLAEFPCLGPPHTIRDK